MGCPECQPGDVEVVGPGEASCTLCGGGFVPLQEALRSLRLDLGAIARQPAATLKCPSCEGPFRELVVGGEPFYACVACTALWAAPGGLARAATGAAPAVPATTSPPAQSAPSERAAPARAGAATPAGASQSGAPRAPEARGPSAAQLGRDAARAAVPPRTTQSSTPRVPTGALAAEAAALRRAASWQLPWRAAIVVLVAALLGGIGWMLRPIPRATVAGQELVIPWGERPTVTSVAVGDHDGSRHRWDHNGARLEVHVFERAPPDPVGQLYGAKLTIADGLGFGILEDSAGPRVGRVIVKKAGSRTLVLSASAPDDGAFAAGDHAQRFLGSLP
ncbi:MAG: hypothetical protein IT383_09315 [Deltaproteobacteria bacterium]|nr:hypothetical protein [Deltaproteobacteria bacterium]